MVMHARKIPRINDGYIDTQQSHLCQNSGYGGERYNHERSPGDSRDGMRLSETPDSSPRYKNSYSQRYRDARTKAYINYFPDPSESPEDRKRDGKNNDFRTNHDRNHTEERAVRIGEWTEHVSSSGKKYYHNWRTEVSQWEKPREWQEVENKRAVPVPDKHSNWRAPTQMLDRRARHSNDGQSHEMEISPGSCTPTSEAPAPPSLSPVASRDPSSLTTLPKLLSNLRGGGGAPVAAAAVASSTRSIPATTSLTIQTSTGVQSTGPPTPETVSSGMDANSLPTVSSLSALKPLTPTLTPRLAHYYRQDLISHMSGWPGEAAEKQAARCSEDAHIVGCLHSTKVSAELKMARSLVRLAEIQATLQEQRILFLRQQIRELEDMKAHSSFMSDS